MIHLYIATPEAKIFDGEVDRVTLPSSSGTISVLAGHEPIMSTILFGEIRFNRGTDEEVFAAYNGVINIENNKGHTRVSVLLEHNENVKNIDIEKANAALERAKELKTMKMDDLSLDSNSTLMRELNRVRLAKKYNR
jgi:F-type H+-transporting ATPase subunit epsilon